jgi:amino acid adenylation domain-containing protein
MKSQPIEIFFEQLQHLNVQIWFEGDRLRYKAPKQTMNPELLQQLRDRKAEILAALQTTNTATQSSPISLTPHREKLPLSFAQQRLWFLDRLEPNLATYNISTAYKLTGALNQSALECSLQEIAQRHESLRTNFGEQNGEPFQIISSETHFTLLLIPLDALPEESREEEVRRLAQAEAQQPFNLETEPLWRAKLLRLSDSEHVLLLTLHHIISDGWSMGLFWRELSALYAAFSRGQPSPLPPLPIQYADFAIWQRNYLQGEVLASQLNYWKQQLGGELPILNLPTDFPRPPVQTHRGFQQSLRISQTLTTNLKRLSQQQGITLYMTLLAAFKILLYRYSRQEDIIVGSPIAGRNRPEIESQIGFFVNTLALRTNLAGNPSFIELLDRVRETTLSAYDHQDLPFEKLIEELQPERSLSRNPVFDVMLNFFNTPENDRELQSLKFSPYIKDREPDAKFAITLYVREQDRQLKLALVYQQALFSEERMAGFLSQFHYLLQQIVTTPDLPINAYSLVTPESKALLPNVRVEINEPTYEPIPQKVSAIALLNPQQPAICQGDRTWSYGQLTQTAQTIARILSDRQVKPGNVVAVSGLRSFGLIASFLGVLLSGGVLLTIDPNLPKERQQLMLDRAKAKHFLSVGTSRSEIFNEDLHWILIHPTTGVEVGIDPILTDSPISLTHHPLTLSPNDAACIFFTSGTTGVPKAVLGTHKGLSHFLEWQRQTFNISAEDRVAQLTALSFDVVLRDIFLPLTSGATLCLPPTENDLTPSCVLPWLEMQQISVLHTVPALARSWLANLPSGVGLGKLRWIFFAGEPLTNDLVHRWRKAFPQCGELINLYGPTETTLAKCFYRVGDCPLTGVQPIGFPLPHTQALVFRENFQLCGIGEIGEIVLRSPFRTKGYLDDSLEDCKRFVKNPFCNQAEDVLYYTGDLGRYRPDGSLEILGRRDRQIKIRGGRVEPAEIEALLSQHPQVEEVVVIDREDRPGDQYLAAYIVPNQKSVPSPDDLRQFLRNKLPDYMIPSAFVPLEALPLNPNSKIDRKSLPAPDWQQQTIASFVAPRNPIEQQLADIWAKVLWREQPISIHDNFFDLGGHSLLAVRLVAEIENSFKTKLPLAALFQLNTVAELAEVLAESQPKIENLEPVTESFVGVEKAEDIQRFPALDPEIHHQLLALTAGWKGQRVNPESLIFGLNTQGTLLPLFWCFQGYREFSQLAKYIGTEQPIYGMRSGHLVMSYTQENIQALAAHYVREILKVQPEGSYRLGGNCQSGRIIFEMARQLQQQGKTVAILCLLEVFIPKLYFGEVALFFGRESDRFNPYKTFAEPELGYRKFYRGGFSINIVSGDHGQYFNEPNIQVLAEKLRETLDRVQTDESSILKEEAYRSQISTIPLLTLQTGETRSFAVTVRNISSVTWLATEKSGIFLANHWLDENGEIVRWLDSKVSLDRDLPPNASIDLEITVNAPKETGQYLLELDLVEEGVTWFKQKGSDTAVLQVMVTANTEEQGNFDRIESKVEIDISPLPTSNESPNSETLPYRKLGDDRFEKGDFVGAIEFYKKAIESQDDSLSNLDLNLGKALGETGKVSEAIACYERLIQSQPNWADLYYNLGNWQLQQGELEKAIFSYNKALEIQPDQVWLYPMMGDLLAKHGQIEMAITRYQTAIEFEESRPELYFNLGNLLDQKGDLVGAIDCYRKAINLNIEGVGAYVRLGNALSQQENFEEAIATYQQAISRHPSNSYAYQMLGNAQKKKGDIEAAITSYQSAINYHQNPQFGAYKNLGDSLIQVGKTQEAIAAYQKARELQPENPSIYRILGNILCEVGDREGAIENYQKAIELNPQQPFGVYKKLGDLLCQHHQTEAAINAYKEALKLQPKNQAIHNKLETLIINKSQS